LRKNHSQIKTKTAIGLLLLLFVSQIVYYYIDACQQYKVREDIRQVSPSIIPESASAVFNGDLSPLGFTRNSITQSELIF